MEALFSILTGSLGGALLVWLLRTWISERLKRSIQHEYSEKLETHKALLRADYEKQLELYKAELNSRIEAIRHEHELDKLRTSLFFDHQREAFASLLCEIAEVKRKWFESAYEHYVGISGPVPHDQYQCLLNEYYKRQLFLDSECLTAMEVVFDALRASFPFEDGEGREHPRDADAAYERLEYLQPRIAAVFQHKIGVITNFKAEEEIALLGAILILNYYHFADIGLPVKGSLQLNHQDRAADAVAKAEENREEVLSKLKEFQGYLSKGHGVFHEAALQVSRYLAILDKEPSKSDAGDGK